MKVQLLSHSQNPEKMIACAAKLCYSSSGIGDLYDGLTEEKTQSFVNMLSSLGHQSPIEHVTFTFGIEGVSRAFLAQMTRHRMASYSVQSQRYVKEHDFAYVIPPEIEKDEKARAIFLNAMQKDVEVYNQLADLLMQQHKQKLLQEGVSEEKAASRAEKMAIEDARFTLPNACETKMVVTMNARSLMNFFELRCCTRAQWEIRAVANEMLRLVSQVAPTLFQHAGPGCVHGGCKEGKMSCGQQQDMQSFYQSLKGIV